MDSNGHPAAPVNHGQLSVIVWPTYVGLGESTDGGVTLVENIGNPDYARGAIIPETRPDGSIIGHGRVTVPKGVYTHIIYAYAPVESIQSVKQLEHPIIFDRAGFVDIDPIVNDDYMPRGT